MNATVAIVFILGLSILLQFIAAALALRLIPISKGRVAWLLIALAILLMGIRRCLPFYRLMIGDASRPPDLMAEAIALLISFCMVLGIYLIGPLFRAFRRSEEELQGAKETLERNNRELRELDAIKDGLIHDVSHELKTPVAKMSMQLEIIKDLAHSHDLSRQFARPLGIMEAAIQRQNRDISNILDLSRLEQGKRAPRKETVHLDQLLGKVIADYREVLEESRIAVESSLPPTVVASDEGLLWHLFSNLVNNAVKFRSRSSPAKITLSLEQRPGEVQVCVADNGIGMEDQETRKAFDRFYQATPSVEGCGLGLAICKNVMDALGGRIRLQSGGRGRGVTVIVTLPSG